MKNNKINQVSGGIIVALFHKVMPRGIARHVLLCLLLSGCVLLGHSASAQHASDLRRVIPQKQDTTVYQRDTGRIPSNYRLLRNQTEAPPRERVKPGLPEIDGGHGLQEREFKNRPIMGPMPSRSEVVQDKQNDSQGLLGDTGDDATTQCQLSAVLPLTPNALISYIQVHDIKCLSFVWDYDEALTKIYTTEIISAVLNKIKTIAATFDGTNSQHLFELLSFVRAGYYHHITPDDTKGLAKQTLQVLTANTHFFDPSDDASSIAAEATFTIDVLRFGSDFWPILKKSLAHFVATPDLASNWYERQFLYSALWTTERVSSDNQYITLVDTDYITNLKQLALQKTWVEQWAYLNDNAIWNLGGAHAAAVKMQNNQTAAAILSILTEIYSAYVFPDKPFIWTIKALTKINDCATLSNGLTVCRSTFKKQLEAMLFPNTFTFDDGAMVVHTPLPLTTIKKLYYASKVVRAQFHRLTGAILPVNNDPNPTLKMIVYGTKKAYEDYQSFLYNLDTDNGGIYIEGDGTFYTYERTPAESIYTLEELFRHEFIHYLQGRFLVQGGWGESALYDDDRLRWFNEGSAEFFAGSTAMNDIPPRKIIIERIKNDGANGMSIGQIVHADYDMFGFKFYRYGCALFNFLYENNRELLHSFFSTVIADDAVKFDALRKSIAENNAIETAYIAYVENQEQQLDKLVNPNTPMVDLQGITTTKDATAIAAAMKSATGVSAQCMTAFTTETPRFSCSGTTSGTSAPDVTWEKAWSMMNKKMNIIVSTLNSAPTINAYGNFVDLTCYMSKLKLGNGSNGPYPIADYYCEGTLCPTPCTTLYGIPISGQNCDDNNPLTANDHYDSKGVCAGTSIVGQACDDKNLATMNDKYNSQGACVGISIVGQLCDDKNSATTSDKYDSKGVCVGTSIVGKTCDDKNPATTGDKYNSQGMCVGTSIVGQACDDKNPATTGDKYNSQGVCVGTIPPLPKLPTATPPPPPTTAPPSSTPATPVTPPVATPPPPVETPSTPVTTAPPPAETAPAPAVETPSGTLAVEVSGCSLIPDEMLLKSSVIQE